MWANINISINDSIFVMFSVQMLKIIMQNLGMDSNKKE